jgi:hypothetical protein
MKKRRTKRKLIIQPTDLKDLTQDERYIGSLQDWEISSADLRMHHSKHVKRKVDNGTAIRFRHLSKKERERNFSR